jgi:hypothetical protein
MLFPTPILETRTMSQEMAPVEKEQFPTPAMSEDCTADSSYGSELKSEQIVVSLKTKTTA